MPLYASTLSTLFGGLKLNRIHRVASQEDLAGKIERVISNINELQTTVSRLNLAVCGINLRILSGMSETAAGASAAFSIFSAASTFTSTTIARPSILLTLSAVSNFSD